MFETPEALLVKDAVAVTVIGAPKLDEFPPEYNDCGAPELIKIPDSDALFASPVPVGPKGLVELNNGYGIEVPAAEENAPEFPEEVRGIPKPVEKPVDPINTLEVTFETGYGTDDDLELEISVKVATLPVGPKMVVVTLHGTG